MPVGAVETQGGKMHDRLPAGAVAFRIGPTARGGQRGMVAIEVEGLVIDPEFSIALGVKAADMLMRGCMDGMGGGVTIAPWRL